MYLDREVRILIDIGCIYGHMFTIQYYINRVHYVYRIPGVVYILQVHYGDRQLPCDDRRLSVEQLLLPIETEEIR